MADRSQASSARPIARLARVALPLLIVSIASAGTLFPQTTPQSAPPEQTPAAAATSDVKPDAKKAKAAYETGNKAEREGDWDAAYTAYIDAANLAPTNRDYVIRREIAKSRVVQSKMDIAERDAISGRLDDAQKQLLSASFIDPLNPAVRKRLAELATVELDKIRKKPDVELAGEPQLSYKTGTHKFDYRGDTQGAYQEIARQFGVEVAFDVDMRSRQVRFRVDDVDFPTAVRLLGSETATFWRPLSPRLFFVADSNTQKRKDFEPSVIRTVLLPASETPDQMTEVVRMVRDVTGITRTQLDTANRTITMRASPRAVALASDLIDDLEKPTGELILEIEVLEVDRTNAQNLGIVPPETASAFTISTAQAREAAASTEGLLDVIEQVLGTSTPNVIAFALGSTDYFSTLPNLSANFSQMLSTVKQGRRVLLRAQDGRTADFFVGERFPVSLATFSPSLLNGSLNGAGIGTGAINNPLTNYAVGNSPSFITTNVLRGNGSFEDLIVANAADNTVSILLGNGDGTFESQVAYNLVAATDKDPVWIATGAFNTPNDSNLDLAVVNKGSNTVSILLGQTDSTTNVASGTFVPLSDLTTGKTPVCVVAADFHNLSPNNGGFLDLAVADQDDDDISIFQGNGKGSFAQTPTKVPLIAGFKPTALATANLTNSGNVDLIVAEESATAGDAGQIQILLGQGDGTFKQAPNSPYLAGNTPVFIATGDFNGDGVTDIAVADNGAPSTSVAGNAVSIYFGNANSTQLNVGNGTFTQQNLFAAGTGPTSIAVADFNQDGFLDLAVSDSGDNAVTLLFNEGTGVFTSPIPEIPVGAAPASITTADFNADGLPDAATADNGAAEATVILNSASLFPSTANSSAGTQFPGAQYLDIGLKIKATPRIHPDKEVTLDLSFDISSLSAQSFNAIPVINNETVTQTVRLKQDETAAVAGFRSTQLSNAVTGNPGLSQIPGLGLLDQDTTKNNADTQLLILVTPRMVRYAPRADHVIYAGQGTVEGQGGGESAPNVLAPPVTPAPAPPGNAPPAGNAPTPGNPPPANAPQPAPDQGQPVQPPQNAPPPANAPPQ